MDGDRAPHGIFVPVKLTGRRPPIERWAAFAAIALLIVVVKPWPSTGDTPGTGGLATSPQRSPVPPAAATPSPSANPGSGFVTAFCLDTRSWLVASVERSRDQSRRVWTTVEPETTASGPDDPDIPVVPVVAKAVTELGWCAPVQGAERPGPFADVTTWLRSPGGAEPVSLDSSRPVSDRSPYGELYQPPGKGPSSKAASWPSGTYVFRHRDTDGRTRWFAIGVEIRPRSSPNP